LIRDIKCKAVRRRLTYANVLTRRGTYGSLKMRLGANTTRHAGAGARRGPISCWSIVACRLLTVCKSRRVYASP